MALCDVGPLRWRTGISEMTYYVLSGTLNLTKPKPRLKNVGSVDMTQSTRHQRDLMFEVHLTLASDTSSPYPFLLTPAPRLSQRIFRSRAFVLSYCAESSCRRCCLLHSSLNILAAVDVLCHNILELLYISTTTSSSSVC